MHAPKRWPTWLIYTLAATPALAFYWLLARSAFNLPVVDDYHAVLDFTDRFSRLSGLGARLGYIVNFQHNEYKLVFENAIFAIQYALFGNVNFAALSMIGNAFVLVLFVQLAMAFRTSTQGNAARVLLLLPVGLVLFQLQYASTLNFSMAGLQNLPVLAFALAAITLLAKDSPGRFPGAGVAMLLAVAASGSGFLLGPVGILMLAERRRWKHAAVWIVVSAVIALVYFNHYDFHSSQANPDGSNAKPGAHFNIMYMLAFMGSSIARYQGYGPSIGAGILLLLVWAFASRKRYFKENPTVFHFFVFLLLTAAGVSAIRSGLGLEQSLASRYRIYSNLLFILTYIFLAESYLLPMKDRRKQRVISGLIVACGLGFCVLSDMAGFRFLKGRQQAVTYEMAAWQAARRPVGKEVDSQPALNLDPAVARQLATGLYKPATATLVESMALGIYRPPSPPK